MQQERLEVVDASGEHTGRTIVRGTALQPGEFHLVVHVWIRNTRGAYLIQQRALDLADAPGIWATTVGHVLPGEASVAAAVREAQEEVGVELPADSLQHVQRLTTGWRIQDVYLAVLPAELESTVTVGPEVAASSWVSKRDLEDMIRSGEFFAYSYFAELPA